MKKTMKVIMLPTDKPTSLGLQPNGVLKHLITTNLSELGIGKFQHLYLLSESVIKTGDWYISRHAAAVKGGWIYFVNKSNGALSNDVFGKIEATTDNLNTWRYNYLPEIPKSFVEYFAEKGGNIKEVEVEMELTCDGCQEYINIEECCGQPNYKIKTKGDNTVIIRTKKDNTNPCNCSRCGNALEAHSGNPNYLCPVEKIYTREEVIILCDKAIRFGIGIGEGKSYNFDKWIEENL